MCCRVSVGAGTDPQVEIQKTEMARKEEILGSASSLLIASYRMHSQEMPGTPCHEDTCMMNAILRKGRK
jgi:hypothetical protein